MAILMRGGVYEDFDPNKLLPREFAVVLSNDTSTRDGKAIYICFGPGKVKRISTFEDMRDDMENAGAEVFEQYDAAFREILAQVQALAEQTEQYKDAVNSIRNDIVNTYMPQIQAAATHAAAAKNSADSADDSAKLSESWAVGGTGTRVGEDTDNSKHYSKQAADLVEEAKQIIAASSSGALIPIDTRRFEDLPITSTTGYMYNISNDFVTDDRFVDGAGRFYGAGNNVYRTADGMWDVLAGIQAAEDFVGTQEEMNAKLEAGELRDGIVAYVDGVDDYTPGGDGTQSGGLIPAGTITYEEIPDVTLTGHVYSISNDFITDDRFEVGAGMFYSAGSSFYQNKSGKFSFLAGIKPASFSGTRTELDQSIAGLSVGTIVFLLGGEEVVSIGRIEVVDGVKQFTGYPLQGGSTQVSGAQVGNVRDLVLKSRPDSLVLTWKDPENVIFNGEPIAEWAGTKVVRKEGGNPESVDDGTLVADSTVRDQYAVDGLQDSDVLVDTQYNYALFPYTAQNVYTTEDSNRISGTLKTATIYGFQIDQSTNEVKITYLGENEHFAPAFMDFEKDAFNYGDWEDAFFMQMRPCMLKYDGTVDYYLDKNDYTKKEDGSASDVTDTSYEGNAMIEVPKIYWKIVDKGNDKAEIYISDEKADEDYMCYAHINTKGQEIPYMYIAIYEQYGYASKARSLSGFMSSAFNISTFINSINSNNIGSDKIFMMYSLAEHTLINILSVLISKSVDSQAVFGMGVVGTFVSTNDYGFVYNGTADKKGMFWGDNTLRSAVKIFGIENIYGNKNTYMLGVRLGKSGYSIKMLPGESGYENTEGYEPIPEISIDMISGKFVDKMIFKNNIMLPVVIESVAGGYCDSAIGTLYNEYDGYLAFGGFTNNKAGGGLFCYNPNKNYSSSSAYYGTRFTCKPYLKEVLYDF